MVSSHLRAAAATKTRLGRNESRRSPDSRLRAGLGNPDRASLGFGGQAGAVRCCDNAQSGLPARGAVGALRSTACRPAAYLMTSAMSPTTNGLYGVQVPLPGPAGPYSDSRASWKHPVISTHHAVPAAPNGQVAPLAVIQHGERVRVPPLSVGRHLHPPVSEVNSRTKPDISANTSKSRAVSVRTSDGSAPRGSASVASKSTLRIILTQWPPRQPEAN
jgi:hypothetical protein